MSKPAFLEQMETVFVMSMFTTLQGGVEKSILRKINYMQEAWDYYPVVLTTMHNPNMWDRLQTETRHMRVVGMFEYLCDAFPYRSGIQVQEYQCCPPGEGLAYKELKPNIYATFLNGRHVEIQHFTAFHNRLRQIDKFDGNDVRLNTSIFDDAGQLIRMILWDAENTAFHPMEYYFTPDKKIRIQVQYRWEPEPWRNSKDPYNIANAQHNELVQYTLFDEDEKPYKKFGTHSELVAFCLGKMASETDKILLAVDETAAYAAGVVQAEGKNIVRGNLFHTFFLSDPYNLNSSINPFYVDVCANRQLFDGMVFLTRAERDDFEKKYYPSHNHYVIPHAYVSELPAAPFEARDGKKVVIVARLDAVKRINLAIEIFKLVAEQLDGVTLDIYGTGIAEETKRIKDCIHDLDLDEKVFMKGATDAVAEVFSKAALSMMTSGKEGLPLTLAESICNGCPAFAFDIQYGPSDIIEDGVTGYLFENNDKVAFANKMVEFLQDEELCRNMSENCYQDAPRFGAEQFLENWAGFLEDMYNRGVSRGEV